MSDPLGCLYYRRQDGTMVRIAGAGGQGPRGVQGPTGPQGPQGPQGSAVQVVGVVNDPSQLPVPGVVGEAYLVGENIWLWNGDEWIDGGPVRGPAGTPGLPGATGEQGPRGEQGVRGPAGPSGPPGPAGVSGQTAVVAFDGGGSLDVQSADWDMTAWLPQAEHDGVALITTSAYGGFGGSPVSLQMLTGTAAITPPAPPDSWWWDIEPIANIAAAGWALLGQTTLMVPVARGDRPHVVTRVIRHSGGNWWITGNAAVQYLANNWAGRGRVSPPTSSVNPPPPPQPPGTPGNLRVISAVDDWTGFSFAWDGVAGASDYEIEVLDQGGNHVGGWTTGATSARQGGGTDTYWQVRVRARNADGVSGWTGLLRWRIGHPEERGTRQVQGTRPWAQQVVDRIFIRDVPVGVDVPANVAIATMTVQLHQNTSLGTINSATRQSFFWTSQGQGFPTGNHGLPWFETFSFVDNGPGLMGIVLRGTGWGTTIASQFSLTGLIRVDGTETFWFTEEYIIRAQENGRHW